MTVVIYQMIRDVKNKRVRPDASRAERVASQVDLTDTESQEDPTDSSDNDGAVESTPCNIGPRASWDDLPLDELIRLKIHSFSGVAQELYGRLPEGSNYADMPISMQFWGKVLGKYGNKPISMEVCSWETHRTKWHRTKWWIAHCLCWMTSCLVAGR